MLEFTFASDHGRITKRHLGLHSEAFLLLLLFDLPAVLAFELVEESLDLCEFTNCLTIFALNWSLIALNLLVPVCDLFDAENLEVFEIRIDHTGVGSETLIWSLLRKSVGLDYLFRRSSVVVRIQLGFDISQADWPIPCTTQSVGFKILGLGVNLDHAIITIHGSELLSFLHFSVSWRFKRLV